MAKNGQTRDAENPQVTQPDQSAQSSQPTQQAQNQQIQQPGSGSGTTPAIDKPVDTAANSVSTSSKTTKKDDTDKSDKGIAYNTELIKLDQNTGEYLLFNTKGMMKINIFFVLKSDITKDKFNKNKTITAIYGREITEISIIDDATEFGLTAGMNFKNENGVLNLVINNHTLYQVVMIISFQDGISETYKLEPYIFDIVEMKPYTIAGDNTQYYEAILESDLTFLARTHHWVSLLKFDQSIKSAHSYEDVFQCILNYFKRHISVSSNKQLHLSKDLYFVDGSPDTHELVEATLKKIPGDSTIYEAVQIIMQDACTSVWAESDMAQTFQTFNQGAIYVPIFFRDEYSDLRDFYIQVFEGKAHDDLVAAPTATPTGDTASGEQSSSTGDNQQNANPVNPEGGGKNVDEKQSSTGEAVTDKAKDESPKPTTEDKPNDTKGLASASAETSVNTGGQGAAGIAAVSDTAKPETPAKTGEQPTPAPTNADTSTATGNTSSNQTTSSAGSTSGANSSSTGDSNNKGKLPLREIIDNDKPTSVQKAVKDEEANTGTTTLVRRHYFLRNMYMPFQMAFADKDVSVIYESFNPEVIKSSETKNENKLAPKEEKYAPILGYAETGFDGFISYPINNKISSTFWKNMVFCYVKGTGTGSSLVYFDWIYRYYHYNFLKTHKHKDGKYLNITPAFYLLQQSLKSDIKKAADDKKSDLESNYKEFCELNSNLFILSSEAPAKEIQFHIGKMLTSFVLLNSAVEFNVPGKIFRRPNEIIKVNKTSNPSSDDKDDNIDLISIDSNAMYTDRNSSNSALLYVRRVTHSFKGTSYMNKIYANRIYDVL